VLFDEAQSAGAQLEFVTERFEDTAIGRFILAARAFIAEVEREKIAERTMRGKAERARSGKLPQATGKGIYGYQYNRQAGTREIDSHQAAVVRRVFERYLQVRSFSAVARELNDTEIPAFSGGRWYPLTVRSMLTNETYTGRSIYRRTRRVKTRDGVTGRQRSRVETRPQEEWIEVNGLSPRIVPQNVWERVQQILQDPERINRRPTPRFYVLTGRARCGICGSGMVGQTLTVKGSPYRYYRCRHVYDKNTNGSCTARYIRGEALEQAVWGEVKRVLAAPAIVLQEWQHAHDAEPETEEIQRLEQEQSSLLEREKRLVRLFSLGEVDEDMVRQEATALRRRRSVVEVALGTRKQSLPAPLSNIDTKRLEQVCVGVAQWLDRANDEERLLALEALQIAVHATSTTATVTGTLPTGEPPFITEEESCRCSFNGDKPGGAPGVPFRLTVPLKVTSARR
jgi:site-specific DNA recombinase